MNIPTELQGLNRWVSVKTDSKLPMMCNEDRCASVSRAETWSDFETALYSVEKGYRDYLGFVFHNDGYVGIDIDKGFDDDGFLSDLAMDVINTCKSYTEFSKSGRGVHIIVKGDLPFNGRNNGNGIEIYKNGRYFITTGKMLNFPTINANQEAIDYLISKYFQEDRQSTEYTPCGVQCELHYETEKGNKLIHIVPTYPVIANGGRNNKLTSVCGQLKKLGYTKKDSFTELCRANESCVPPLPKRELENIVSSVYRYGG